MTASSDGPIENVLYALLPAVFRQQDIAQGYPLLALTKVFDTVRAELAVGIAELEQDWFIQTCPLEYVPLIGGLLGLEIARPVRPEHRALVADTLGFRRRKGIAPALPKLVRDSTGWYALYSPGAKTPWATWPLADAATAPAAASAGLLRVWRLPVFAVIGATPAPAATSNYYHFNPLGMDQPVFNLPGTPLDWVAAPPVTALAVPLTAAMLTADLARYAALWPDPVEGPADSLLYGPARGLVIRTNNGSGDWTALPPESVRAASLAGYPPAAPDYPVLTGGTIDLAAVTAVTSDLTITFGDATAQLSVAVPATPTMPDLVTLLQNAIAAATIVPGKRVSAAAVQALRVGAVGDALVLVPGLMPSEPLSIAPSAPGGANPLLLVGSARLGSAAATLPLTPQLIGLLTGAPTGVMTFTAPAGQTLYVPLPFVLAQDTVQDVALAFAAALPTCCVCDAGDRVVVVPPYAAPQPPVPATPPAYALGLVPAATIDPELGLFSWPTAWASAGTLSVDYGMAMPGAIGGVGPRPPPPVPASVAAIADGGDPAALQTELGAWAQSTAACTVLMLQAGATRSIASQQLAPASGQALWIAGAAGSMPYVVTGSPGQLSLLGAASPAEPGLIGLSGVTLQATIALLGGDLELVLLDSTLYPGAAPLALAAAPPPPPPPGSPPPPLSGTASFKMVRCLLGPIDLSQVTGRIEIDSSVLSTLPVPDATLSVLTLPATVAAKLTRLTVIGGAEILGKLDAADSLFDGGMVCSGAARFIDCYVSDLQSPVAAEAGAAPASPAEVKICGSCGKARAVRLRNCLLREVTLAPGDFCTCETPTDGPLRDCVTCADPACAATCPLRAEGQSWALVSAPPRFIEPNLYPQPDFARLSEENPAEILSGASNRDVLGAYNLAGPTARLNQFKAALKSGLLLGTWLDLRFED
ncbi:MAG TPA: hypothetical protein VNU97_07115 [Rhizomicrobium sp.]|jgi:hypothetical protein|nr:hypothetical protein [Rhizomicrobium sp.]